MSGNWIPSNPLNIPSVFGSGGLINILLNAAVSIAAVLTVIYLVIASYNYILSKGDDAMIKNAKNGTKYALIGLASIFLALALVRAVGVILGTSIL